MDKNFKTALIIGCTFIAAVIIIPSILWAIFGWQDGSWGMMGSGMWGGWMFMMPVFFIAFWGLVIWGIIALVRGLNQSGRSGTSNQSDSALEILKKRYASGEIDRQEYEEKKKDLS